MRRRMTAGLISLASAGAAVALWTGVANAQSSSGAVNHHPKGSTLSFDVKFSPFFLIDFGATGVRSVTDIRQSDPSKGDVTVFRDELRRSGKVVGHDGGACTITALDPTAPPSAQLQLTCNVTFQIPGGTITTQGLATNAPVKPLVITGGTGAYLGAKGEVTLTEFGNDTGSVVFHLAR
jgi:Dirigent-like protein